MPISDARVPSTNYDLTWNFLWCGHADGEEKHSTHFPRRTTPSLPGCAAEGLAAEPTKHLPHPGRHALVEFL